MRYSARAVLVVLAVSLLFPPGVLAKGQGDWCDAPLSPEFVDYLKHKTKSGPSPGHRPPDKMPAQALSSPYDAVASSSSGLIPRPFDLSHLTHQSSARFNTLSLVQLPAKYDPRTQGRIPPIKNQGNCGTCWAYASYASLESSLLPWEQWDFSENHLKNTHGFDVGCCEGGADFLTTSYLARWSGPVTEADDPYNVETCDSPGGLMPAKHVQNVVFVPGRDQNNLLDIDYIKEAILKYGALYLTCPCGYPGSNGVCSYSPDLQGIWCYGHAVALVGWDDNYDRSNFCSYVQPPGDGAFIWRNSYGASFGEGGYFYTSYYDRDCASSVTTAYIAEPVASYTHIYQYDWLGCTGSIGWDSNNDGTPDSDTAWGANVFTADTSDKLAAVGFYTYVNDASYEIDVYLDPTSGPINSQGPVTSKLGSFSDAGYHTVALDQLIPLQVGQRFSVVIKLTTPGRNYPIAIETPNPGYSSGASANAGESYISGDGISWVDLTTKRTGSNVCLKAYSGAYEGIAVGPESASEFHGPVGGPFDPIGQQYTLTNPTSVSIDWSVTNVQGWLGLSVTGGTLAPGASTVVTVSINPAANTLTEGYHYDELVFRDLTNNRDIAARGVTLIIRDGRLEVTPYSGLQTGGPSGGPFNPSAKTFTLVNSGYLPITWTAVKTQSWSGLSATGGTLQPGESTGVTVSVVGSPQDGCYQDTVTFTNLTNSIGNTTRPVSLVVGRLYVRPDGNNSNDGTSWDRAKQTVQAAIDTAVAGQEVWVAAGTYVQNLTLKDGVALYGGFTVGATSRDERNWTQSKTILDGNQTGSVIKVAAHASASTRIDGFTIRGGSGTSLHLDGVCGGGICCVTGASPVIANNTIITNTAEHGAAIYFREASAYAVVSNNVFTANDGNHGVIYCGYRSSPAIINNTIVGNRGELYFDGNCSPTIANNIIAFNSGGIRKTYTGGTPVLRNNCVYANGDYDYQNVTPGEGDFSDRDPMLASVEYGDAHIQPGSPCINAGWIGAPSLPTQDIDVQVRPDVGGIDIGADESYGETWAVNPLTVRVSTSGNDANDGSSWPLAKRTIQAAIDAAAAQGGEVWVMAGQYNERITMRKYVHLYGGFDSDDSARSDRDWKANVTVIDGTPGAGQDRQTVVTILGLGYLTCTVDGFTIRGGLASMNGGGILCGNSSPTIAHNTITGNDGLNWGGGIYCESSSARILDNTITANIAGWGGGIACRGSYPIIVGNVITGNDDDRAAICLENSAGKVVNNTIVSNRSALHCYSSVYEEGVSIPVANNLIAFNGAGIYKEGYFPLSIKNNCFYGNAGKNYDDGSGYNPVGSYGNIGVDPKLASVDYNNPHIQLDSPCINAGSDDAPGISMVTQDMDGQPRKNGVADIGADESYGEVWSVNPAITRVKPNGNDANDGSSWILAKQTLQAAIDAAAVQGGGEVWAMAGQYNERIVLKPYVYVYGGFDSEDQSRADRDWTVNVSTIDGTPPPGEPAMSTVGARNIGFRLSTVDGFTIQHGQAARGGGVSCENASIMVSHNIIISNSAQSGGAIWMQDSSPDISANTISGNSAIGFSVTGTGVGGGICCESSAARIVNNVITENTARVNGGGMYVRYGSAAITNNTLSGNQGGIYIAGGTQKITNTIVAFGAYGISCAQYAGAILSCNCVYGNNGGDYEGVTPDYGSISTDPGFADQGAGDYRLGASSPCVDKGVDVPGLIVDRDGNVRPRDGNGDGWKSYDIGAYESSAGRTISRSSVALADLDSDHLDEAVFGTADGDLHVTRADGTELVGWPVTLPAGIMKAPAVGDLDSDGSAEIVVVSGSKFYAFEADGSTAAGWPEEGVQMDAINTAPTLGDIDGDGCLEAIAGAPGTLAVCDHDGTAILWPEFGDYMMCTPAVGDLDGDGAVEIFGGTDCQSFFAFDGDGTCLFSRYDEVGGFLGSPAMADMDGDGKLEAIAVTYYSDTDGWVLVLNEDGSYMPGWPVNIGMSIQTSPAVGDTNGDGSPEIVVVRDDGKIYTLAASGAYTQLADLGSPAVNDWMGDEISPILADVDGDGSLEIIISWYDGKVHALNSDGSALPGWPKDIGVLGKCAPAIGNMGEDGAWDIVLAYNDGTLCRWEVSGDTSSRPRSLFPWPTFHGDNRRDGAFLSPAIGTELAVTDVQGRAGTEIDLIATLTRSSDGAPLIGKMVNFEVNGEPAGVGYTDSFGRAFAAYTVPGNSSTGTQPIVARYAGDAQHVASSGQGMLSVYKNLYVNSNSPGPVFDGTSWATAFHTVQAAIDTAMASDEVWVASGTYNESITMKEGVALYGGFAGTETLREQRNWRTNVATLTNGGFNSVVSIMLGATITTRIDGFTITGGYSLSGGGIDCGGSAAIVNNTITGNSCAFDGGGCGQGGGISCRAGSPLIQNNIIRNNSAQYGGGIYCRDCTPIISNNIVAGNSAIYDSYEAGCGGYGGGIYCMDASPSLTNNTITGNTAGLDGGGVYCRSFSGPADPNLTGNIIAFNSTGVCSNVGCVPTFSHNDVFGNTDHNFCGVADPTGSNGNISVDPLLADWVNGNVHLASGSPCINTGDDNAPMLASADIDGQQRKNGTVDMGADEYLILRVKPNGNNANDGLCWDDAKRTVQAAIDAASAPCDIWVKAGTYGRITLKNGVQVYGGFAGTEVSRDQRNWNTNVTTLDAAGSLYVVLAGDGITDSTVLDGFTITCGSYYVAGGVFCTGTASPVISHNVITGNSALYTGAGVSIGTGSPKIVNNIIANNSTGNDGGGICCGAGNAVIANNTIVSNSANRGGGIYCSTNSHPTIANNVVAFNLTGSGVYNNGGTPTLRSNDVYGNLPQDYVNVTPGLGDISMDPLFVNRQAGNYHLLIGSPCMDIGWNSAPFLPIKDMDVEDRICGDIVDIGADEVWQ